MEIMDQVLVGLAGLALILYFWPGAKAAMQKTREAENPDWAGALIPVALVVLFVILLIVLVR